MKEIKTEQELSDFINENRVAVVKYGADWCGPCRVLEANIKDLENLPDDVAFAEVNVDEADEELIENSRIRNVPVLEFYLNGSVDSRRVGAMTKQDLQQEITSLLHKL